MDKEINLAQALFLAEYAKAEIEMWLEENCPHFCKFGYDNYDESIEIYLGTKAAEPVDQKILDQCRKWGFSQGWINYVDKEEYWAHTTRYGIKDKPNSWAKRAKEFDFIYDKEI